MLDLGPHASFIIAAYGVTAIAVIALTVSTILDDRTQRKKLAELERQGIRRRSAGGPAATPATSRPKTSPSMTAPLAPADQEAAEMEETKKPAAKRKAPAKRKTPAKAKSNARKRRS